MGTWLVTSLGCFLDPVSYISFGLKKLEGMRDASGMNLTSNLRTAQFFGI